MRTADPVADLRAAEAARQLGFLGYSGFGLEWPGVMEPDCVEKHGVRGVVHLSDTAESSLADSVYEYVELYNFLLTRHLRDAGTRGPAARQIASSSAPGLARLALADPVDDFARARRSRDLRFVTLRSYGLYIPGVVDRPRLIGRQGVHRLDLPEATDAAIKRCADEYLEIYNRLVVRYLRMAGEVTAAESLTGKLLEADRLRRADPVLDLRTALRAGERGLIGCYGFGLEYPGLDKASLVASYGERGYVEVGDEADASLYDAVLEYAQLYNLLLLRQAEREDAGAHPIARGAVDPVTRLVNADPVADSNTAVAASDLRFVTLRRYDEYIPGAQTRPRLTERHGVKLLESTAELDATAAQRVDQYLRIYNLLLVRRLRSAGEVTGPERREDLAR